MLALSIRQPFAELILRGIKTAELRSRSTRIVGERFFIYAARARAKLPIWSDDLHVGAPPAWMLELAEQMKLIEPELLNGTPLPTGVIVGSAVIEKVIEMNDEVGTMNDEVKCEPVHRSSFIVPRFRWHLVDVERASRFRKPRRHPQPVWFQPF